MAEARIAPVHDEGRHGDRRQHVADVDLAVHPQERQRGPRARRASQERSPGLAIARLVRAARRGHAGIDRVGPVALELLEPRVELLLGHQLRARAREGAVEDQRGRALRVGRGEERAHRAALGDAHQRGPLRPDRVHDRADVVHPLLQDRQLVHGHPVGEPGAALVEDDQPCERREPPAKGRLERIVPGELDVRGPARHEHEVDGPVADHLVGDVDVAALGVPGLRRHCVSVLHARRPRQLAGLPQWPVRRRVLFVTCDPLRRESAGDAGQRTPRRPPSRPGVCRCCC